MASRNIESVSLKVGYIIIHVKPDRFNAVGHAVMYQAKDRELLRVTSDRNPQSIKGDHAYLHTGIFDAASEALRS